MEEINGNVDVRVGGNKKGKQTVRKGGEGNKDLCVKAEVEDKVCFVCTYVCTYVSMCLVPAQRK